MTDDDPELGRVRWCKRCDEWWPDDAEFWRYSVIPAGSYATAGRRSYVRRTAVTRSTCRGCQSSAMAAWYQDHRETRRAAYSAIPHRCPRRACPVWLPAGRRLCHAHAKRPTVPMTVDLLRHLSTYQRALLHPWINAFPSRSRGA